MCRSLRLSLSADRLVADNGKRDRPTGCALLGRDQPESGRGANEEPVDLVLRGPKLLHGHDNTGPVENAHRRVEVLQERVARHVAYAGLRRIHPRF